MKLRRAVLYGTIGLVCLVLVLLLAGWLAMRASLPLLEGELALSGLRQDVVIGRDALGVAVVKAGHEEDLVRGIGFLHAQERFFQMDLLRRSAAGEIAALVGDAALEFDRDRRMHGLRAVASRIVEGLPAKDRRLLTAYVDGVNAGLAALSARPFEYFLLRSMPAPWQPEDTLLVVYAMYFDLHDAAGRRERERALLNAALPAEVVQFLFPAGTPWDAPLVGEAMLAGEVPSPDVFDLRSHEVLDAALRFDERALMPGSNSWAVSGALTADGRAMVANDMHLGHGVPNIWFRLQAELSGDDGYTVTGVSLPGTPGVIVGSNGKVAWSFTNSYGDWLDLVLLEPCEHGYRTTEGCEPFETVEEHIESAHGDTLTVETRRSRWGPVVTDVLGDETLEYALHWQAHSSGAVNLRLFDLARASNVNEAVAIAQTAGMPPQNFIVGDSEGNIAWTIAGRIPRRAHDGSYPLRSSSTTTVWDGWLSPQEYPVVLNPADGRLWSANARMVDGEALVLIGDGGYALGARAMQIRDRLREQDRFSIDDMLRIQLDDEARFLERWHGLFMQVLEPHREDARRSAVREALSRWEGHASVDSVAYRLVREFRVEVIERVYAAFLATTTLADSPMGFGTSQAEGPVWTLLSEQPPHLLPANFDNWNALLLAAADTVAGKAGGDLDDYRWGLANRSRVSHPLGGLPLLDSLLNAPAIELPGDSHMPRVQGASFGASERFAVSPGREQEGYFHMPGGQSGHPLSPFYLAGHEDWANGQAGPFLPGEIRYRLILQAADN